MATVTLYSTRRADLMTQSQYKWLAESFGESLNERTRKTLKALGPLTYDVFQVEQLLSDLGGLLDRCLVYRREYEQLDTEAVKAALDDALFVSQLSALKTIDLAQSIEKRYDAERTQQAIAAGKFVGALDARKWLALADVAGRDEAIKGEKERKKAVGEKWAKLEKYMAELRDRHTTPGNSLYYKDRTDRLLRFYLTDVAEAYQKARAVDAGLKLACGIAVANFPNLNSEQILDDLVSWSRQAIDEFERFREKDTEFEFTAYMRQPNAAGMRLITEDQFHTSMSASGDGQFVFDLSDRLPSAPALQFVRLKGVGMSMSMAGNLAADLQRLKLYRMSAVVFPPDQKNPVSVTPVTKPRQPLIVTNITITDPTIPVRYSSAPTINNIDPRGSWRIKVSKTVGYPDTEQRARPSDITDIKLHLLLSVHSSTNENDWQEVIF